MQNDESAPWPEGKVFKGGRNERPMTPRPAPPAPLGPLNQPGRTRSEATNPVPTSPG
jgi:hypothetical protein